MPSGRHGAFRLQLVLLTFWPASVVGPVELWGDTEVMFHACKQELEYPDKFNCHNFAGVEITKVNALRLNKPGIKNVVSVWER